MERKIGEVFEYEGVKLQVVPETSMCAGCYWEREGCGGNTVAGIRGHCYRGARTDESGVIFKQITEEQKMNNLEAQILWHKQKLELLEQGRQEDPEWECRLIGSDFWQATPYSVPSWNDSFEYRPKAKKILMHGIEFPEPLRVEPEYDTKYWCVRLDCNSSYVDSYLWEGDNTDVKLFKASNAYQDKETALEALKAFKQLLGDLRPESYWSFD